MPLDAGDPAPAVRAANQDGETVTPDFADPTVVYFYPRDETRGCSIEAREFDAALDAYRAAGVSVYGVSTDGVDSHAAFVESEGLDFDLLADPDGELVEAFGVEFLEDPGEPAAARTTFVLADGEVQAVYAGVDPEGHAEAVLADLRASGLAGG
ncbi:MAG: peroxiredoxin [Halobacteriales archaeon]